MPNGKSKANTLPVSFTRIISGISDYNKETTAPDGVAFARQIDFRTDPRRWTILPKTTKESGNIITGLPVAGDRIDDTTYIYDDAGNIYTRSLTGSTMLVKTVANSHGNGMQYFGEDGFLYYPHDKSIGRYGRIGSNPTWVDDFLTAEGGVPLNTHSLDLEASSSQYATAADSATDSIQSDLSIEINFKPESLPTAGNEMVLLSKWNKASNKRSFKFSVYAVSGYFGDGSDGALVVSVNATDAPIDSACSGTLDTNSLSATNASFAAGQIILIYQTQGTGAGTYQRTVISSYTAGTITTEDNLIFSFATGAQVLVLKRYSAVTINSGITLSCKAWNGTVGGIYGFICSGTFTNSSTAVISATGCGFRGGAGTGNGGSTPDAFLGEGYTGLGGQKAVGPNGNGGGCAHTQGSTCNNGAGGGNGTAGTNGSLGTVSVGGISVGTADLTSMFLGGGGGGGSKDFGNPSAPDGGTGGGIIFIAATNIVNNGSIFSNGTAGVSATVNTGGGGGGGGGGSILLKFQTGTLGTNTITATGGAGGLGGFGHNGGAGGDGRIHSDYLTSISGTTTPTLNSAQDNSLVINTTYQARLGISSTGTNEEFLTKSLNSIQIGDWSHLAVSWDASDHQAEFMEDGNSIGSSLGALTAINDNNSLLAIGASFDAAGAAEGFLDGKVDDIRLWAAERTASQINNNRQVEINSNAPGLNGYWQVDNSTSDSTANANNLTLVNAPVYTTDVPFSSPTTRLDIDQSDASTGDTYATLTTIDEGAANIQSFIPAKDPQKSIGIYISALGTNCDWTVTVHDPQNRVIASKTLTHAQVNTGHMEFIFDSVWRPVIGATYHFHVTTSNTTGTPLLIAGTNNNLETTEFKSYYQFLVEDIYHPLEQITNILTIGNERYVAVQDPAGVYNPHRLVFPAGWRVRTSTKWREYVAFGCWKGENIFSYDKGIIFFWDGYSDTYNFYIEVPEGGINAMVGAEGLLQFVAGYQGDIMEYNGGDKATKVKRIPNITPDKYIEILPNALTTWKTLLHVGAGVTDSEAVEQGVYSYGTLNQVNPKSLSFDYAVSTGTTQSTLMKIGLIMPIEKKLLIGFKDNLSFGLDVVDPAGVPYSQGSIEFMIRDEGGIWKEKRPDVLKADFDPLIDGHSISLQMKLDREIAWSAEVEDAVADEEDAITLRFQPTIDTFDDEVRHREMQVRVNLKTTNSTSPGVMGVTVMEDAMTDEGFV